jgi:hypothetical protein
MFKVRSFTELYGLRVRVESYMAPKCPLQCKRCQRFGHTQPNCGYTPRCVACGGSHITGLVLNPAGTASVLWLRGKPHSELQGLYEVKKGEGSHCKASS